MTRRFLRLLLVLAVLGAPFLPMGGIWFGPKRAHALTVPVRRNQTAPAAGLSSTSPSDTAIGDLVIVFTWERAGAGVPTHTLQTDYSEIESINHNDGSTDGRMSVAYIVATSGGAVSYQAYTSSNGTETWTGIIVYTVNTFDVTNLAGTSSQVSATGTGAPNPPSVTTLAAYTYEIIIMASWHLTASQTLTPSPPSGYTLRASVAGAATGDIAVATKDAQHFQLTTLDPAAWTDDQTPNGTCGVTIALRGKSDTIDMIQQASTDVAASGSSIGPTAYPAAVTSGNDLVAVVWWNGAGSDQTVTFSDTVNGSWTQAGAELQDAGVDGMSVFYFQNTGSGTPSVTASFSGTFGGARMVFFELQGTGSYGTTNAQDTATSGSGTDNSTSNAITPSANNSLLIGCAYALAGSTTITAGTGWTTRHEVDNWQAGSQSIIVQTFFQSTAASKDSVATIGNTQPYHARIISWEPTAAGSTPYRMLMGVGQ